MAYDKHSHKYFGATLQIITILPQNAFYMLLSIFILLTNFLAHFVFLAPFINMRLLNTFLQTTSLNQTILSILFVDSFLLAKSIKIIKLLLFFSDTYIINITILQTITSITCRNFIERSILLSQVLLLYLTQLVTLPVFLKEY